MGFTKGSAVERASFRNVACDCGRSRRPAELYNRPRLHSTLGCLSPMQYGQAWLAAEEMRVAQATLWDAEVEGLVKPPRNEATT